MVTLKQFVGCCQRIISVWLTILWDRRFKVYEAKIDDVNPLMHNIPKWLETLKILQQMLKWLMVFEPLTICKKLLRRSLAVS